MNYLQAHCCAAFAHSVPAYITYCYGIPLLFQFLLNNSIIVFCISILPKRILTKLYAEVSLILAPVTPQQTTSSNVAINLDPSFITAAFRKIGCNQSVNLTLIVK